MKKRFWDLPHSSKLGQLDEGIHIHHIKNMLADSETDVEQIDYKTFIFYGEEEALVFIPTVVSAYFAVKIYKVLLDLIKKR